MSDTNPDLIAENDRVIEQMATALLEASDFFTARDVMNAKVHLQEVRWSPITTLCSEALAAWRSL